MDFVKKIKLMPDYHCHPLWHDDSAEFGDIDPDVLPLSDALKIRIKKWAAAYDASLNVDDPALSGFKTTEEERKFAEEGELISEELKKELGGEYLISLFVPV